MSQIIAPKLEVSVEQVQAEFDKAADTIRSFAGGNSRVSKEEFETGLANAGLNRRDQSMVSLLNGYARHQNNGHLTFRGLQAALDKAKAKLVADRDTDGDHMLDARELAQTGSRMVKIASSIVRDRLAAEQGIPDHGFSHFLNRAIEQEWVKLELRDDGSIKSARISQGWDMDGTVKDLAAAVLGASNGRGERIESFDIGHIDEWETDETYQDVLSYLASRGPFDTVKQVTIGADWDEAELSWFEVGNVADAFKAFPNLEKAHVRGNGATFEGVNAPKLKELTVETAGASEDGPRSLAGAHTPKLEKLSFWLGSDEYTSITKEDLKPLFESGKVQQLTHFGMPNAYNQDDVAKEFVKLADFGSIKTVDFSLGTMEAEGAQALIANKEKFAQVTSIDLRENYISAKVYQNLRAAFGDKVRVVDDHTNLDFISKYRHPEQAAQMREVFTEAYRWYIRRDEMQAKADEFMARLDDPGQRTAALNELLQQALLAGGQKDPHEDEYRYVSVSE
ncbi:MAG: hypothetical protein AAF654_11715 [Myxococcota bacterium]